MSKNIKKLGLWIIVGLILVLGISLWIYSRRQPEKYDAFARCLKDKGAIFYGTFWCSYCQSQKAMFGKSAKYLPYVECSTPDGRGQLSRCREKNLEGYPTWEFADGSREMGRISLARLAEKTGCLLEQ